MKIGACPQRAYLTQESYGQEMSAGDKLQWRNVVRSKPHEPMMLVSHNNGEKYPVQFCAGTMMHSEFIFTVCKHCGTAYIPVEGEN
jgi:hypothetical protein